MRGSVSETHVYDADGRRVKAVDATNNITTTYVAPHYEIRNGVVKKYYQAGGVRVALRDGGTLYWLLSDHPSAALRAGSGQHQREA